MLIITIIIILVLLFFLIFNIVKNNNIKNEKSHVSTVIVGEEKVQVNNKVDDKEKIIEYTNSIYFYDIKDVKFEFENYESNLKEKLKSGEIHIDKIIEQAEEDEKNGKIQTVILIDGKSKLYMYDKFFILKTYSSAVNSNIYISKPNIEILKEHKKEKEEKISEYSYSVYFCNTEDIEFEFEGEKTKLKEKLKNGEIHIDKVIEQVKKDEKDGKIKSIPDMDGGSILYIYDIFTIYKQNSANGERNIYIKSKN